MQDENIIWEGKPQYKPRLAILEIAGGESGGGAITVVIPILLTLIAVKITLGVYNGNRFNTIAYSILLAAIILLPEIHKSIRRKNTLYKLKPESISITNYWYGSKDTQELHFKDIDRFYLVNYNDDIGEIHIFVKDDAPKITSRNFYSGSTGFNVILYDIKDSAKTFKLFEVTFSKYKNAK